MDKPDNWQHSEKTKEATKKDKPEQLATWRENQRGNQKWTNKSNWQHREKTKGAIKNGQIRATGNIERKLKGQSKMDIPEQLAT